MIKGQAEKMLGGCWQTVDELLTERENFDKMLKYAGKYEISIQFWGSGNTNVFIAKGGVDLTDFGGLEPAEAIERAVKYLDRINGIKEDLK